MPADSSAAAELQAKLPKSHVLKAFNTVFAANIASKKTLQKLGGQLLETVEVPAGHWLYQRGETVKNIYRFLL